MRLCKQYQDHPPPQRRQVLRLGSRLLLQSTYLVGVCCLCRACVVDNNMHTEEHMHIVCVLFAYSPHIFFTCNMHVSCTIGGLVGSPTLLDIHILVKCKSVRTCLTLTHSLTLKNVKVKVPEVHFLSKTCSHPLPIYT